MGNQYGVDLYIGFYVLGVTTRERDGEIEREVSRYDCSSKNVPSLKWRDEKTDEKSPLFFFNWFF